MDIPALAELKGQVRSVELTGALTLEQALFAASLNRDVERFHAEVTQAERILDLAGVVDERLVEDLAARGTQLVRLRHALTRDHEPARGTSLVPGAR